MTLSYEITHVSSNSAESVSTLIAEKTTMSLKSNVTDPKSGRITATYILGSGDSNHPATVRYVVDPPASGITNRYGSVTVNTWATQTDSITGIVTWYPIQATMSFVIVDGSPVQLADFNKLIAAAYSYTYLSQASGVRDTTWLQTLLYGSPQVK
jgi:hypothetical protein